MGEHVPAQPTSQISKSPFSHPDDESDFLPCGPGWSEDWAKQYDLLAFPEDGDLSKAREGLNEQRKMAVRLVAGRRCEEIREIWKTIPMHLRARNLTPLLLGSLAESARASLMILSTLPMLPRDWKTRCDCLLYLDTVHADEIKADAYLQELFARQIAVVSRIPSWPKNLMRPVYLLLLLRHNDPEHCDAIIATILESYKPVTARHILIMVDHFHKSGDGERALELLNTIPAEERESFKEPIIDRCFNLLEIDSIEESGDQRNFKLLPRLIDFGMPMDSAAHNRLIERAITLKLHGVAMQVFHFMVAENIHIDARSHLFLLKNSFDRHDLAMMNEIMSSIHAREDVYQYPYMVAYMLNIVRVVCKIERKLPPEESLSHLLGVYDRVYDRGPLIKLGLVEPLSSDTPHSKRLPDPPPAVLGFFIWSYVLCQNEEQVVSRLWHWIIHLIKHHDETICRAARHDILYNGFLHFFSRSSSTLMKGLYVIEEMIERGLCSPTERSWSEVLCGFLTHGEEEAAEKIWRMMISQGLRPTKPGWEHLLTRFENSSISGLVSSVVDERKMPEGLEAALGAERPDEAISPARMETH